jgi:hypothetical protein
MTDKAPALRAALIFLLKFVFGAVLFFGMLALPRVAVDGTHDLGSQLLFEIYYKQGTKFGTEVIQNIGPYGFLTFPFSYGGFVPAEKLIYNFAFTFLFVLMVLWTLGRFHGIVFRASFVATISYFFFQPETSTYIFFLMAACLLMSWPHSRAALIMKFALVPVLAVLTLTKALFLFCSLLVIGFTCVGFSYNRRHDISLILMLVYAISLALLWFLAGQGPGNVIPFVVNALEFSSLYNDAMALHEPLNLTIIGAALVFLASIRLLVLFIVALRQRDIEAVGASVFFGLLTFLAWKHGFVRAGGHTYIFFFFITAAAPLLMLTRFDCERRESRLWLSVKAILCAGIVAGGLLGIEKIGGWPNPITRLASNNLQLLGSLRSDLGRLEQQLQANKIAEALNETKKIVDRETIDNFGIVPGVIAMNELNYRGRPMPIRFMALGSSFQEKNAAFYRDDNKAPHYVLMTEGSVDGRLLAQDDAPAFLELLAKYRPVLMENGTVLFERRADHAGNIEFVPLSETSGRFEETFPIPLGRGRHVWACVDIRTSLLGSLYKMLYKLPQINIRLSRSDSRGSGWPKVSKFIPIKGGSCFLAAPLINTNWDFVLRSVGDLGRTAVPGQSAGLLEMVDPDGMQFVVDSRLGNVFFDDGLKVRFFSVSGIPDEPIPSEAVAQRLFTFDRLPSRVEAGAFGPMSAYGKPATLVHAPAKVDFDKPAGLGKLTADFGMLPSSFGSGSGSDGVIVSVTFTPYAGGETSTLFERILDPVKEVGDRGIQKLAVDLPRDEAGTLSIVIGMRAHAGWDHSFLANLTLTP